VDNCTEKENKLPYEKPGLLAIELAAEEVLSTGCKNAPGAPGIGVNGCGNVLCSINIGS
jgi:hypothetical protein